MLNLRICDVFEGETNESTFKEYIRDLEDILVIPHEENLKCYSDEKLLDYIDALILSINIM